MNSTRQYIVKGAHCGACIEVIKRVLNRIGGIEDMSVDYDHKQIILQTNDTYDETAALAAVSDKGYELQVVNQ